MKLLWCNDQAVVDGAMIVRVADDQAADEKLQMIKAQNCRRII